MKRSKPLQRVAFKRVFVREFGLAAKRLQAAMPEPIVARLPAGECGHDTPRRSRARDKIGVYARSTDTAYTVEKRDYVRSRELLAIVRTLPCQLTGLVGQTEPAHSNWAIHGKGGKIKADDNRVAAICRDRHRDLDQGSKLDEQERKDLWWLAHTRTVRLIQQRGLWPAGVPVPDIDINPFAADDPSF